MEKLQKMVKEFHEAVGSSVRTIPQLLEMPEEDLRISLMEEELNEYIDADAIDDLVGVADALGDLLYVTLGTALAHGIDIEPIFEEIHRSNMTKVSSHLKTRQDGKVLKGLGYEAPKIAKLIKEQRVNG